MSKRKQYSPVDRKLQVRVIFRVLKITVTFFAVAVILLGVSTGYYYSKIFSKVSDMRIAVETEDYNVNSFLKFAEKMSKNEKGVELKTLKQQFNRAFSHMKNDHRKNIDIMKRYNVLFNDFLYQSMINVVIILVVMIVMMVILYIVLVRSTNRIAGPLFILSRHMQEIMDGKEPGFRELRKDDEFADFYEDFKTVVEMLKKDNHE